MKTVILSAVSLAVLVIAGCGSNKCERVCLSANACTPAQRPVDYECVPFCADVQAVQGRAVAAGFESCDSLWQEHLTCWETNRAQICASDRASSDCAAKGTAWVNCMKPYCAAIASQMKTDPNCTGSTIALVPF